VNGAVTQLWGLQKKFREFCVTQDHLWYNINMEGMDPTKQLKSKESYHERKRKVHIQH
jgi:hypothetical protein